MQYVSPQELRDLAAQGRPENPAVLKMLEAAGTIEDLERQLMDAHRVIQELRSQPVVDESVWSDKPASGEQFDEDLIELAEARIAAMSDAVRSEASTRIDDVVSNVARSVADDVQARIAALFQPAAASPAPAATTPAPVAPAPAPAAAAPAPAPAPAPAAPIASAPSVPFVTNPTPPAAPQASAANSAPVAASPNLGSMLGMTSTPAAGSTGDSSVLAELLDGFSQVPLLVETQPAPVQDVAPLVAPAFEPRATTRPEAPARPTNVVINAPLARPEGDKPMPWA